MAEILLRYSYVGCTPEVTDVEYKCASTRNKRAGTHEKVQATTIDLSCPAEIQLEHMTITHFILDSGHGK